MNRSSALCYVFQCRVVFTSSLFISVRRKFKNSEHWNERKKKVGGVWAPIDSYVLLYGVHRVNAVRGECCATAIRSNMYVALELLTEGSFNDAALCAVALPSNACVVWMYDDFVCLACTFSYNVEQHVCADGEPFEMRWAWFKNPCACT